MMTVLTNIRGTASGTWSLAPNAFLQAPPAPARRFRRRRSGEGRTAHDCPDTGDEVYDLCLYARIRAGAKGRVVRGRGEVYCGTTALDTALFMSEVRKRGGDALRARKRSSLRMATELMRRTVM